MADYNILVKNKSGSARAYFLFVEPPKVSGVGASDVYQNVYITAPSVPNNTGTASIRVHKDFYAVTGTSPSPLGASVSVTTGDYEIANICQESNGNVTPGSTTHVSFQNGGVEFNTGMLKQSCQSAGSFSIITDSSFDYPNPGKLDFSMHQPNAFILLAHYGHLQTTYLLAWALLIPTTLPTLSPLQLSQLSLAPQTSLPPSPNIGSPGEPIHPARSSTSPQLLRPPWSTSPERMPASPRLFTIAMAPGMSPITLKYTGHRGVDRMIKVA